MAIIGISGKKNSGKDLVGDIIQYLTSKKFKSTDSNEYFKYKSMSYETYSLGFKGDSIFKIKKFADKLKNIVCLLIGCTREQLEDEEFKNTELGKEWWFYTKTLFFNKTDKVIAYIDVTKEIHDDLNFYIIKPTPRFLMEHIGTNLFRNQLHSNIWVNSLMKGYIDSDLIITDLRFPNELKAIKDKGGISIRINRQIIKHSENHSYVLNSLFDNEHPSETALDNAKFDYVIENNSDISALIKKVREILIKENIIK